MKRSNFILTMAALILTVTLQCCKTDKPYLRFEGFVWGTTFHITYASNVNLDDSIMMVMKRVDNVLSPFNEESLVSRLNRGDTVEVDSLFSAVFRRSQLLCGLSHGAFDPTLGPVIDLWGFGPSGVHTNVPTPEQIDSAKAYVGVLECSIDSAGYLHKKAPGTRFDFSSIAKGFGCDLVADFLNRSGVENYLIEIGGEVVANGESPRHAPWRVMVDAPIGNNDSIVHDGIAVINLSSGAIATSGDYRNYHLMDDGSRATHIIDPMTGSPARSEILSVTILAPDCMEADGLATACGVMPLDSALALVEPIEGVEALFVTRDSIDGAWRLTPTAGFPDIVR